MISDQTRRKKSKEVSSRYLSPIVPPPPSPNHHNNHTTTLSPNKHKNKQKHTGFIRGLWPSSATNSSKSQTQNQPTTTTTTLADHFGRKDGVIKRTGGNSPVLSKQKSCTEFRRSDKNSSSKEHHYQYQYQYHTPIHGSMRKTGKLMFSGGRSSISSTSPSSSVKSSEFFDSNNVILPGRLSVDENALRQRSDYFSDNNSEGSDLGTPFYTAAGRSSPASYMASTMSSRRFGIEVPSKFMNQSSPMHSNNSNSNNISPMKSTMKSSTAAMKRTKSLSSSTEWESCPSRFGSRSPLNYPSSFSTSKPPPSDPSRGTKKNLLHMGLDLIKGKKKGGGLIKVEKNMVESVHQLRLLQNSWMQWRYANARAEGVHENLAAECENNLLCTRESMMQLRQSVVQKRLQLQKEKLEMKLHLILSSQMKMLEAWEGMERRHTVDLSIMKDYLHNVVCMIPIIEGAKMDLESTSIAFQHSSHIVDTIKSVLSSISPTAHETILPLSKLAEVVAQEKLLLEECFEHIKVISELEIQERNLRCSIIAMDSLNDQQL